MMISRPLISHLAPQSSAAYCATLAHKTNHSFSPNREFVEFKHPKYGVIPCLLTIRDIPQDHEVETQRYIFSC